MVASHHGNIGPNLVGGRTRYAEKAIYILETKFAFHKQETCLEAFIDKDCYIWRISRNESNGLIDVIVYISNWAS
jgi:hypothetical protein